MSVFEICCLVCAGKAERCPDCIAINHRHYPTRERASTRSCEQSLPRQLIAQSPVHCLATSMMPSFVSLTQNQDLWDAICWSCSGNSILCMADVRLLRTPTISSPAYRLLAGRDIDHCLVPWCDRANILESLPTAVRGGRDSMLRHMSAIQAVDPHEMNIPMAPPWRGYYTCGGPARPSSPLIAAASRFLEPPFAYSLPNPCEDNWRVPDLAPPVFPPAEHFRAYLAHIKWCAATPDDSESDTSTSASSWHGASSWR
jgi:hypothetical protein